MRVALAGQVGDIDRHPSPVKSPVAARSGEDAAGQATGPGAAEVDSDQGEGHQVQARGTRRGQLRSGGELHPPNAGIVAYVTSASARGCG